MEDMVKLDDVELEEVTGGYSEEERKAIIHKIALQKVGAYVSHYKDGGPFLTLEGFINYFPEFMGNSSGRRSVEYIVTMGDFRYTYGELYDECLIIYKERLAQNQ